METIVSFIESNPGISFLNLQLFFGAEIKASGITEAAINAACMARHRDGSVQLGNPDDVDDYVVNIPLSVFDTATVFKVEDVYTMCTMIAQLKTPVEIVLNEQTPNYKPFLDMPVDKFEIPLITAAYNKIKVSKDAVSKVREMLQDFQPMLLERMSHSLLNKMCVGGVRIFKSVSDFIKAFTDPAFFELYQPIEQPGKPKLLQMTMTGDAWVGHFGKISLIIPVMPERQGTAAGNRINAGNVIQAALLYKDRKNDFVRSNSALSMIKNCGTQWPDRSRSEKIGTRYTFPDLYTGEKIVQLYDGKQPDFVSQEHFVSILENYHEPRPKTIHTNQEHIVAVYPGSCIFNEICYYETLVDNLQMITQKANNDVNSKEYEHPLGKLKYLFDIHEKQKQDLVGKFYWTEMDLCRQAMLCTTSTELDAEFAGLIQKVLAKEAELKVLEYQTCQELNHVNIRLGIRPEVLPPVPPGGVTIKDPTVVPLTEDDKKVLLDKKRSLGEKKDTVFINLAQLSDAKKIIVDPRQKKMDMSYPSVKKMVADFHFETEYHTRKALLMSRLDKLEKCCLNVSVPAQEAIVDHRREIVMSCIDSVAIIVSCAKISVLTVTSTAEEHKKLVKDSKDLEYLRSLSLKLFHDYKLVSEKRTAQTTQTYRLIHAQGELMEVLQKHIIKAAVTDNELLLARATHARDLVENEISKELIAYLLEGHTPLDIENFQYSLRARRLVEINGLDAEIQRLTVIKNKLNGEFSYLLNHLHEVGAHLSLDLLQIANVVNRESLLLLNLLGEDKSPDFEECMRLLTKPESRHAPVSSGMVVMTDRDGLFEDVGIKKSDE